MYPNLETGEFGVRTPLSNLKSHDFSSMIFHDHFSNIHDLEF
jgi:hypothetical protein